MRNNNAEMKNCNNLKINQVLFEKLVRFSALKKQREYSKYLFVYKTWIASFLANRRFDDAERVNDAKRQFNN